jgi:hypothetical protein
MWELTRSVSEETGARQIRINADAGLHAASFRVVLLCNQAHGD